MIFYHSLKQQLLLTSTTVSISTLAVAKHVSSISSPTKSLQMRLESIAIDSYTILYTLKACTHFRNAPLLRHLHAHIFKLGFTSNVYIMSSLVHGYTYVCFKDACNMFDDMSERSAVTWNTMITGFSRLGNVDKARCLFDEMPVRNVASWAAMISGYVGNGCWNKGVKVLREMVRDGRVEPDEFTLCSVLGGCGRMDMIGLVLGKSIHGFIVRNEWELNVELGTALVDMYAKCGFLKVASLVFNMMRETNVVSWTALICGAAQNGYVNEARTLFERMQKMGVRPNEFTFTGILSACVQAGLVEEGRRYFQMIKEYGLKPNVHHYCCIVDLFGKAGELEDAYAVIMTMKLEANMNVWGSFLNSCKVENNFKMAERIIYKVIEMLRPEKDGGVYTLIADLFVMGEKWDDAERMRRLIVSQNVRKARGASLISSCSNANVVSYM